MRPVAVVVLASAASLAAGVWLGGRFFASPDTDSIARSQVAAAHPAAASTERGAASIPTTVASIKTVEARSVSAIWAQPAGADRTAELRLALRGAAPAELERWATSLAGAPPSATRDGDRQLVLELWARRQPAEALAHADAERDPRVRSLLLASAVAGAMAAQPSETLARAAHDSRDEVVQAALECLGSMESARAMALLGGLGEASPVFRQRAHWAVLENVVSSGDYERARELVRTVSEPALQQRLTASLADAWGRADPRRAAEWAAAPWADESGQAQTLANIGATWAAREPQAATEFAARLTPGASRERMLTETVLQWATADLVGASNWINRLDASPENDPAVAAIATDPRLMNNNPTVAASWAESIASPERRLGALRAILQTWQQRDPVSAGRYLAETPTLKAEERAALRVALQAKLRD